MRGCLMTNTNERHHLAVHADKFYILSFKRNTDCCDITLTRVWSKHQRREHSKAKRRKNCDIYDIIEIWSQMGADGTSLLLLSGREGRCCNQWKGSLVEAFIRIVFAKEGNKGWEMSSYLFHFWLIRSSRQKGFWTICKLNATRAVPLLQSPLA